jgi:hypothetical protein
VHIRRISFVGVKTESFDAMTEFARYVLDLAPGHRDGGWAVFQLRAPDGEVYALQQDHGPGVPTDRGET